MMELDGFQLRIDYREELQAFEWDKADWREEKLMAASPFRQESHASFYCYLEDTATAYAGNWGDAGAFDPQWERGGFVKLLSFLRKEDPSLTAEYLKEKYAIGYARKIDLELKAHPKMKIRQGFRPMDPQILDQLRKLRHTYLDGRGISRNVQIACKTGYDPDAAAIAIPWINPKGQIITIKFRSVRSKFFWYHDEGADIRSFLWGMDLIYKYKIKEAAIVEAEIDALWLISCGIPALATGNKYFNKERADLIVKSGIQRLILFQDNDKAGDLWKTQIADHLKGRVDLAHWQPPQLFDGKPVKDVNDVRDPAEVLGLKSTAVDIVQHLPKLVL